MKETTRAIKNRCDEICYDYYLLEYVPTLDEALAHNHWYSHMKELTFLLNEVCETKTAERYLGDAVDSITWMRDKYIEKLRSMERRTK